MKIYLIEYSEGYYEDRCTRIIKAFTSKEKAEAFKLKYNNLLDRLKGHIKTVYRCDSRFYYIDEIHNCTIKETELI